jgi:hypothetical protein
MLDLVYFAESKLDFKLEEWQKTILRSPSEQVILLCARQAGKSTLSSILALHMAIYFPGTLILLLSPTQRQSAELFRKVKDLLTRLPFELTLLEDNKLSMQIENLSRIVSLPGSEDRIRGFSAVDFIIVDEAAYVSDDLFSAALPMLASSNGKIWLLSTPWRASGLFYRIWHNSDNSWDRHKVVITEVEHIASEVVEQHRSMLKPKEFQREYLCQFIDDSGMAFNLSDIENAISDNVIPLFGPENSVLEYKRNFRGRKLKGSMIRHYIGVDIGQGESYTAIAIVERVGSGKDSVYNVIHLGRLPIETQGPGILRSLNLLIARAELERCILIMDRTGIGKFVCEFAEQSGMKPRGITITSGIDPSGVRGGNWKTPKKDLVGTLQRFLWAKKLKIAKEMPLQTELREELAAFQVRTSPSQNEVFGVMECQRYDDLAMVIMLPIWYGENADWADIVYMAV